MRSTVAIVFTLVISGFCLAQGKPANNLEAETKSSKQEAVLGEKPISFWMERKLELSQTVFAALASGDFETMEQNATQLQVLSKIEGFVRRRTPEYTAQLRSFELANREIIKHAKEHKLEGAALAFQQLTISCVSCHKLLRDGSVPVKPIDRK